jgi:hypothetical protein
MSENLPSPNPSSLSMTTTMGGPAQGIRERDLGDVAVLDEKIAQPGPSISTRGSVPPDPIQPIDPPPPMPPEPDPIDPPVPEPEPV